MRKAIMKQTKINVIAKLISIIGNESSSVDDVIYVLKALSNGLEDFMFMV